jgi:hypothetical protein
MENKLQQLKNLGKVDGSGVLLADITGGIVSNLVKLADKSLQNREKVAIMRDIISQEGFDEVERSEATSTFIKKFYTIKTTDKSTEYSDNLNGARALMRDGYNVYMLHNPKGVTSGDYILEKGKNLYYVELKTIYGQNSLENRLDRGSVQADRLVLNMVGNVDSRYVGNTIKKFYLRNPQVKEIKVLLGGKPIVVVWKTVKKRDFLKTFMGLWG